MYTIQLKVLAITKLHDRLFPRVILPLRFGVFVFSTVSRSGEELLVMLLLVSEVTGFE